MKKILLVAMLVLVSLNASAWSKEQDEGVVILASKYLTPTAKQVFDYYLGTTYSDDVAYISNLEKRKRSPYTKEVHYLHLDGYLQPTAVEGDDAVKAIEAALTVVQNCATTSKTEVTAALRTIIQLMCDMHCLSNVRIASVSFSQQDFTIDVQRAASGSKAKEYSPTKWSTFWNVYSHFHKGYFGELWAEEMDVCHGAQFAEFTNGGLRNWASNNGARVLGLYRGNVQPAAKMSRVERLRLEDLNFEMMAKASFRLAALLNNALKQ